MPSRRFGAFIALVLLSLMLVSCGSAPPVAEPKSGSRLAINADNRGYTLFNRGDYSGAARAYADALRHEQSIDNDEGIAIQLLNLSITFQRLGNLAEAENMVDRLLRDAEYRHFNVQRLVEAHIRKSILLVDQGSLEKASQSITEAEKLLPDRQGILIAKIANVRAEINLRSGQAEQARLQAEVALAEARIAKDQEETANALRNLGASLIQLHQPEAEKTLMDALTIDKSLELPRKIARDLLLLGQGATDESEKTGYLKRALETAEAVNDERTLKEAQGLMNRP